MKPRPSRFSRPSKSTITEVAHESVAIDYDDMTFSDIGSDNVAPSSSSRKSQKVVGQSSLKTLNVAEIGRLMDVNRELTQATAIDETNRGFKLLQKFGYQSSQGGLGKLNTGLAVPLTVEKRDANDRAGLGVTEVKKRKLNEIVAKETLQEVQRDQIVRTFKTELQLQQRAAATQRNLAAARRSLYELDCRSGIIENTLWPEDAKSDTGSDEAIIAEPGLSSAQNCSTQLDECTAYLKEMYHFCIFCGIQYDNQEEFEQGCPGPHEDDH
jgi:Domain of unknown function (DUF4187)/G-patch domain